MQEKINRDAALVLLSGGQDSTTCLYWAKEKFAEVTALTFDYGQTHRAETEAAEKIAALAGVEQHCADASFIATIGRSALTDHNIPMDETRLEGGYPNTFVPGRNMFFLGIAAVVARERGINHIVTGVSQTDFSGYPDCRDTFIKAMNVTLNEAMDYPFVIDTPLMWLDKEQTWALADRLRVLDIVRSETLTCYNGIKGDGCGHCPACRLRRAGLEAYLRHRDNNQTSIS